MKKLFLMLLSTAVLTGCGSAKVNMSDEMKLIIRLIYQKKMVQIVLKEMAIMKTLFIMHTQIFII